MKRLNPDLCVIDHVLAAFGCTLAVYSVGMSLLNPPLALFFGIGVVVTATTGYALSKIVRGTPVAGYDSYFWAVLGMFMVGFVSPLNDMLPGGGFPFELLVAGALCWVLLVGNLFAWRDQTLLFLTLPCIAIFGLVGTFDTFMPATALFFLFMLTIALLYARVHQRTMIHRAKLAGVEDPMLLRRSVWKWMAGPEWALSSALLIILFSFMGAPMLQGSLQTVAGNIQVTLPQPVILNSPTGPPVNQSDVPIGRGPLTMSDKEIFKVRLDRRRYLRLNSFSTYTGNGWKVTEVRESDVLKDHWPSRLAPVRGPNGGLAVWPGYEAPPQEPIVNGTVLAVTIKDSNNSFTTVLAPGPLVEVDGPAEFTFLAQGTVKMDQILKQNERLTGYSLIPSQSPVSKDALLPDALNSFKELFLKKEYVTAKVRDFAYRAVSGIDNDYDKAAALQKAIEGQVRYNLRTRRTPDGRDPVEYFLYESQEGYCDLFASSMALTARSVGLPSRYTTGYIINDPEKDDEGFYTVRSRDFHAWCEIYFEGVGWVPFDPTEGAPAVGGAGVGASGASEPWYRTAWFKGVVIGVIALALVAPILVMFLRRTRTATARAVRAIGEVARLHASFSRAIEKHVQFPKRFSQTTREFVEIAGPKLGPAYAPAYEMVGTFESAMFSSRVPGADEVALLGKRVAELRTKLGRMSRGAP
ncbi:MAG: transglutaminase domain-containing protein [Armatimonadetes bacterium]|nr:transglutaminase domain-containing protein [Armatimonadota bacterium]